MQRNEILVSGFFCVAMDCQVVSTDLLLLGVKEDIQGIERRLSALEHSHRSLCKSHMELEVSHDSLNGSHTIVLEGLLELFDNFLRCVLSSESPNGLRFVIHDSGFKGDVDGVAA